MIRLCPCGKRLMRQHGVKFMTPIAVLVAAQIFCIPLSRFGAKRRMGAASPAVVAPLGRLHYVMVAYVPMRVRGG
jgi:hypothetical protein